MSKIFLRSLINSAHLSVSSGTCVNSDWVKTTEFVRLVWLVWQCAAQMMDTKRSSKLLTEPVKTKKFLYQCRPPHPRADTQGAMHSSNKSAYSDNLGSFQYKKWLLEFLPALSVIHAVHRQLKRAKPSMPFPLTLHNPNTTWTTHRRLSVSDLEKVLSFPLWHLRSPIRLLWRMPED